MLIGFLYDYLAIQIFFTAFQSIFNLLYLIHYMPFKERHIFLIEIFSEICILVINYGIISLTIIQNLEIRENLGFIMIGFILLYISIGWFTFVYFLIKEMIILSKRILRKINNLRNENKQ